MSRLVDVEGCSAPPCDVGVPGSADLHPLTTVAVEWNAPLVWSPAWADLWKECGALVVHASHEIQLHRPATTPMSCRLSADVVGQRATKAGAFVVVRYRAEDSDGPVWTTLAGLLFRGLTTTDRGTADSPKLGELPASATATEIEVAEDYAHTYSHATGIWNPIHTDPAAAHAAGLDAPILHGSATLGLALTAAAAQAGLADAAWSHVTARFLAAVTPPDVLTVHGTLRDSTLQFAVRRGDGEPVLVGAAEHQGATS